MAVLIMMIFKALLTCFLSLWLATITIAQDKVAILDVHGLTCSLCSRHVENAVSKLPFVKAVDVDLEQAVFKLHFNNETIHLNLIFQFVKKAGFSVGSITLDKQFVSDRGICLTHEISSMTHEVVIGGFSKLKGQKETMDCKYVYEVIDNS